MNKYASEQAIDAIATDAEKRLRLIRLAKAARNARLQLLGPHISRDVPWGILLSLYTSGVGTRLKITALQAEVEAPATSVIRWLQTLEQQGYVLRHAASDRRVSLVSLSPEGRLTLDHYFEALSTLTL